MPRPHQAGLTVPRELLERVRALPLRELGYSTPTDLVRDAIREKCEALEAQVGRPRAEEPADATAPGRRTA